MVASLRTDCEQTYCLDKLCRLDAARTSFDARVAGQAFIYRFRLHKRLNVSLFDHRDELMRMILHLVIRGAGARAFSASHTLADVNAAHYKYLFFEIHLHASLIPSAVAKSSVKYFTSLSPFALSRLYKQSGHAVMIISAPKPSADATIFSLFFTVADLSSSAT